MLATISSLHGGAEIIPVTPEMIGKSCKLVVLGLDPKHLDFKPDVWQTTGLDPWQSKMLILFE